MTSKLAFLLAGLIVAAIIADHFLWDGTYLLFLGKKFIALIHYVAFWR